MTVVATSPIEMLLTTPGREITAIPKNLPSTSKTQCSILYVLEEQNASIAVPTVPEPQSRE
jgi:hypothetical protein